MPSWPAWKAIPHASPDDSTDSVVLMVAAAALLGLALQLRDGHLDPVALPLMTAAFVALVRAIKAHPVAFARGGARSVEKALGAAIGVSLVAHLARPPGIYLDVQGFAARIPFVAGLGAVGALCASVLRSPDRLRTARTPLLITFFLAMGAWVIRHSPDPHIDVFVVQRDAIARLLGGHNPYEMTFPDIYGPNSPFFPPGLVAGGRLQFGYPYPPLCLWLALPGVLLAGDVRVSQLLALAAAGALLAGARRDRIGFLAAALLLFSPRTFFVLEQSWTDSFVTVLLALVVFCACRWRPALPVALGLFFASKHYLVLAIPLCVLLAPELPRGRRLIAAIAVAPGVAAAVTLPLALIDVSAFWNDLITVQLRMPFRVDSLSFPAGLAFVSGIELPSAVGFLAACIAVVMALRHCARTPSGFSSGVGFVYFAFFAFNRQAFCNYYFVVLAAICAAIAARQTTVGAAPPASN